MSCEGGHWPGRERKDCLYCREVAECLRRQGAILREAWDDLPLRDDFTRAVLARLRPRGDQTPMP